MPLPKCNIFIAIFSFSPSNNQINFAALIVARPGHPRYCSPVDSAVPPQHPEREASGIPQNDLERYCVSNLSLLAERQLEAGGGSADYLKLPVLRLYSDL